MVALSLVFKSWKFLSRGLPCFSLLIAVLIDEFLFDYFPLLFAQSTLFYWTIYRPDLLPFSALFVISIVCDGLCGQFLGKTFLVFLLTFLVTLSQRRSLFQASFSVIWVAFGFYMIFFTLASYGLDCILLGQIQPQKELLYTYLGALASHPVIFYMLMKTQRFLK